MKNVEILLREHVTDLGRCGDVVRVAPGYARNYLFPHRMAVQATPENMELMKRRRTRLEAQEATRSAEARTRAEAMQALALRVRRKADRTGHLFGSVNAADVAELLRGAGFEVADKDVRLEGPLKSVGEHPVRIHLHGDLDAEVTVAVEAE